MAKVAATAEKYKVDDNATAAAASAAADEEKPLLGGGDDDLDLDDLVKAEWDIGKRLEQAKQAKLDTMEEVEKHFDHETEQWRKRLLAPALLTTLPFFPAFLSLLNIFFGNIVYHVTHEKDTGMSGMCGISRLALGLSIWVCYAFMFAYGWFLFQPHRVTQLKTVMWTWIAIYIAWFVVLGVIGSIAVGREWGCPDSTRNFDKTPTRTCESIGKPGQPLGNYCYDQNDTPGRYNKKYLGRPWRGTSLYAFVTFEVVIFWIMTVSLVGFLVMYHKKSKQTFDGIKSRRTKAVNAIIAAKNAAEAAEREAREKAERDAREKKEAAAARKDAWQKEEADKQAKIDAARRAKYGDSDDEEDDDDDSDDSD